MTEKYEKFVEESWTGPATVEYCAIGFGGEAGEVLNEIKKEMRDGSHRQELIRDELGDTLFYFTRLCRLHGYTLDDIMQASIRKVILLKECEKVGVKES